MNTNNEPKLLFVINPGAGTSNAPWKSIIEKHFSKTDFDRDYYLLQTIPDLSLLANYILQSKPARVIAVGGDGTVALIAKIIAGSNMALGILPAGSANGMAKELNIPVDIERALAIIEKGNVRCCDMIRINKTELCLHLADIGLNAKLIKYFDDGKLRGKWGYASVLLKTLWRKRKMQVTIKGENSIIQRHAFMVVLANASKYGTGAVINPGGSLTDSYFEVVIVRKLALSELFKMMLKPQPFDPRKIEIFHTKQVKIAVRKQVHFQIDGEYKGKLKLVEGEILPAYINLILP